MVKITVQPDCGNAPKMQFLRDFTVAFSENKPKVILDSMADDIRWEMVGEEVFEGKAEVVEALEKMLDDTTDELTIEHIITHGDTGAVNGSITFDDGTEFGFCDVYTFTSHAPDARLKTITSYVVDRN